MSKLLQLFKIVLGMVNSPWATLAIVSLTLLVAIFLTIPLAVYLNSHKKAANWVLQVAVSSRPFPQWLCWVSLFLSWGLEPYRPTALVIYAIFPILENTITAERH